MTSKHYSKSLSGMSLIETMVVVAAIGVAASISVPLIRDIRKTAQVTKLESDVATLNSAVKSYVSSGGSIEESDSADKVLNLLKQKLSALDAETHVGFTGSHVDPRLTAEPTDDKTSGKRVIWDFDQMRFKVTDEEVDGIARFSLSETVEAPTENRGSFSIFKYSANDADTWVWKYGVEANKTVVVPSSFATAPSFGPPVEPILISLAPIEEEVPPLPEILPEPVDPNRLSPPYFSIGGGNHPLGDYQLPLTIVNPNAGVPSAVIYRKGNSWMLYEEGTVLPMLPDSNIDAFVFSYNPRENKSSTLVSAAYNSSPVQLDLRVDADSQSVSYLDLTESDMRVRWEVANLDAYPEYLKTDSFFSTYWTNDSTDPSFEGNRTYASSYSDEYVGESLQITPELFGEKSELALTFYAESNDTTWIKHSEKPSVTLDVKRLKLPSPNISLTYADNGQFRVTLTPVAPLPEGSAIFYNASGVTMNFDRESGLVSNGKIYSGPYLWSPDLSSTTGNTGNGVNGKVNIDRGEDVPITELVLKTGDEIITQNESVSFSAMEQPGADTMRGATVIDSSNEEISIESITINDGGKTIVADNVNVLNLTVKNLNYPKNKNLSRVAAYENGEKLGDANGADFQSYLQQSLRSKDLRDYVRYDGDNSTLEGTSYDFDVIFSPLRNSDYLVVMERFGNSTFDLKALDSSGGVIAGSQNVVVREYSWNTGYAPSDHKSQPLFFVVIDIEKFAVDTDRNSITGFRINNDGGADFKFFTISDDSFVDREVNYEGDLSTVSYPLPTHKIWYDPSDMATAKAAGTNNGHGNNVDGVDVSNPGNAGFYDESGSIDDEKK